MLKTLQIIRYLKSQGFDKSQIFEELVFIVDNERSEYFELSSLDVSLIRAVFENDKKLDSAFIVAGMI